MLQKSDTHRCVSIKCESAEVWMNVGKEIVFISLDDALIWDATCMHPISSQSLLRARTHFPNMYAHKIDFTGSCNSYSSSMSPNRNFISNVRSRFLLCKYIAPRREAEPHCQLQEPVQTFLIFRLRRYNKNNNAHATPLSNRRISL